MTLKNQHKLKINRTIKKIVNHWIYFTESNYLNLNNKELHLSHITSRKNCKRQMEETKFESYINQIFFKCFDDTKTVK